MTQATVDSTEGWTALPGAEYVPYKSTPEGILNLNVFPPTGPDAPTGAGIVFFFGGGWRNGRPSQFAPHCRYLASRGLVAAAAEYRVLARHGTSPFEAVADAKSAVRWLRTHAEEFGIDTGRIAAAGGSAGGHLAACTGTCPGLESDGEDSTVSSVPNALVLFNPVVDLESERGFADRFGPRHAEASPLQHVDAETPPAIVFHGVSDTTVPITQVRAFQAAMKRRRRRCDLVAFENSAHGFFNFGRSPDNAAFHETLTAADRFLASLGFLAGPPRPEGMD